MPSESVVSIHPLSLLGISDYYTRIGAAKEEGNVLIGGLLGKVSSVLHSFEILINENGIDQEFLDKKLRQLKVIYPSTELIGFYQISPDFQVDQLAINLISSLPYDLQEFVFLLINPNSPQLPIKVLNLSNLSEQLVHKIESAPSERASLNSIRESELKPNTQKPSEMFISKNDQLRASLTDLSEKVSKVIEYLKEDTEVDQDEVLMEISKFVFELDYIRTNNSFKKELSSQKLELLMAATSNLMVLLKPE